MMRWHEIVSRDYTYQRMPCNMMWQFALSGYLIRLSNVCLKENPLSLALILLSRTHLKTHSAYRGLFISLLFSFLYFYRNIQNKCNVECKLRNARYQTNDIINMRHIASSTIRNAFKCSDYNIRMILQWIRIASIRQNRSTVKMQYMR